MIICLERGTDLHVAQLMPLPLTVSCFSKIQIVFGPGQRAVKHVSWHDFSSKMFLQFDNFVLFSCHFDPI